MEITQQLVELLAEQPIDYIHISTMHVHGETREGKYAGQERLPLIHRWIDGRMPLIGIGSIFTADQALDAVETADIELVALGRELALDYQFISKIEKGKEQDIISTFDSTRQDHYELPPNLWKKFNNGFYPLPRTDEN